MQQQQRIRSKSKQTENCANFRPKTWAEKLDKIGVITHLRAGIFQKLLLSSVFVCWLSRKRRCLRELRLKVFGDEFREELGGKTNSKKKSGSDKSVEKWQVCCYKRATLYVATLVENFPPKKHRAYKYRGPPSQNHNFPLEVTRER